MMRQCTTVLFRLLATAQCNCRSSHMIKLKRSSQLIGQFGRVTDSAIARKLQARGVGQGLFAESAMIMCTGFNCIPCMHLKSTVPTPN